VSKLLSDIQKEKEQDKGQQTEQEQASEQAYCQVWQQVKEQGIQAEKLLQGLHEVKTHLNSPQLSSQAAEQTSVTAQGQVMVFALTIVAVCLACVSWMVEYCCWQPCVPGNYCHHIGCGSANHSFVLPSSWHTQEIQF